MMLINRDRLVQISISIFKSKRKEVNLMKAMQSQKSQTAPKEFDRALWKEIDDSAAAQLSGGELFKGWAKCQVPGKCEVGISIVVKF